MCVCVGGSGCHDVTGLGLMLHIIIIEWEHYDEMIGATATYYSHLGNTISDVLVDG